MPESRPDRLRVAFPGEPGAFAEEAILDYFGDVEAVAVPSWRAAFEAVRDTTVDAGVVAIESSLAGSIRETYDLLNEFYDDRIRIIGEVSVPVRLALLALPGQSIDWIERVYSHAQALAQADEFLRARDWQVLTTYNTAGAARMIADGRERRAGAIASPRVAQLYGLEVLADNVQSGDGNRTRFAILGREADARIATAGVVAGPSKTTLVFAVRNVPGSLHRCLGAFAERGVAAGPHRALGVRLLGRPRRRRRRS
jgi:prephenate dehydratase